MKKYYDPFDFDHFYHVYNRGNNRERIFFVDKNYRYFLQKLNEKLADYVDFYCYCLLPNHFHLLVKVKSEEEFQQKVRDTKERDAIFRKDGISKSCDVNAIICERFRRFFIGYSMAVNKQQGRSGSLFQKNFKRIRVDHPDYFDRVVYYIHRNPVRHDLTTDFVNYAWSSYQRILNRKSSRLQKHVILEWFNGAKAFMDFHQQEIDLEPIDRYVIEE